MSFQYHQMMSQLSKMTMLVNPTISNMHMRLLLNHILTNTWYYQMVYFYPFWWVETAMLLWF